MMRIRFWVAWVGLVIIGFSISIKSQEAGSKEKTDKANEVLNFSRQVVFGKTQTNNIKSIALRIFKNETERQETTGLKTENSEKNESEKIKTNPKKGSSDDIENDKNIAGSSNKEISTEISFEFPKKIKLLTTSQTLNDSIGSSLNSTTILDGEKYKNERNIFVNGKPFDTTKLKLPGFDFFNNTQSTDSDIAKKRKTFLDEFWFTIFPILLDTPWDSTVIFEYVGKAEADGTRTNIIKVKSLGSYAIQLFFDEKTHLLLMMTVKNEIVSDQLKVSEDYNYFFADYEKFDGLLVAKKITVEGNTTSDINKTIMGFKVKQRITKSTSEIIIKEVKINSTFKPNTFLITDEKK
jgi:hypothetical protein